MGSPADPTIRWRNPSFGVHLMSDSASGFLQHIPLQVLVASLGALLAALIAAVAALAGVLVGNFGAARRQRIELRSAEDRAHDERQRSLKQSLYLEMLSTLGNEMHRYSATWNLTNDAPAHDDETKKALGITYQLYLVATPTIVHRLISLSEVNQRAALRTVPIRFLYSNLIRSRNRLSNFKVRVNNERERLCSEIEKKPIQAPRQADIDKRMGELDEYDRRLNKMLQENILQGAKSAMNALRIGEKSRKEAESKTFELIFAIREELGLAKLPAETIVNLGESAERLSNEGDKTMEELKVRTVAAMRRGFQ